MDTEERRTRFNALQTAYDRGHEINEYLRFLQSSRTPLSSEDAQHRIDAYHAWFRQTLPLLNAEERIRFEFAYTGDPLKPRLRQYLNHYADERDPESLPKEQPFARMYRWLHPYSSHYDRFMAEQINIVATARKRMLDVPSVFPPELLPLISQPFASRK
ncbi:hypothetical protein [Herpetosiphon geysericola]|uniref:Uncharacterized protein n=1 Tax=Herpetosiphon geysericola TaxID=70996 RepID=A0A0P6XVI5_9CHLR|nr:hypothetical protein [Herpetosiphon geysericola]KPL80619.1 hypothetical protein SE18_23675 [Herpetosiphon geysericola]